MTKRKRKQRGETLPARWTRSKTGTFAEVTRVVKRHADGRRLYRLRFGCGVRGNQLWTLAELIDAGVRWLKRRPRDWREW